MVNKQLDGGFISKYAINKAFMEVTIVNSQEYATIDFKVSFILMIRKLVFIHFDILANRSIRFNSLSY